MASKEKIIVTGGSGFIGTNLIEHFVEQGHQILNLDIKSPRNTDQINFWSQVDVLDLESLSRVVLEFSPSIIYHLAARTDLDGKTDSDYVANTIGVENLIKAAAKCATLKKIIFASSRLVCRIGYEPKDMMDYCPDTLYGKSKVIGEEIVRHLSSQISCPWIIVRPTSIWGPWFDAPYKNFFSAIFAKRYLHPGYLKIKKTFGYVGNTVYQLNKLGNDDCSGVNYQTIYLADYESIEVGEMANVISHQFGHGNIRHAPFWLLKCVAIVGDLYKKFTDKNPPLTTFRLRNLITTMEFDLSDLEGAIGPLPYAMSDGVEITCKWMCENGVER